MTEPFVCYDKNYQRFTGKDEADCAANISEAWTFRRDYARLDAQLRHERQEKEVEVMAIILVGTMSLTLFAVLIGWLWKRYKR